MARLSRIDVLVIDDWAMAPMKEQERRADVDAEIAIRLGRRFGGVLAF